MTNDGANTLVYDAENRVLTSTGSAAGAYTYDGNNLRVKKVSGSTTTVYLSSGSNVNAHLELTPLRAFRIDPLRDETLRFAPSKPMLLGRLR
jgi:hypothetical protein